MNDIVDLQSREDFDNYMRQLEQKYYQKANLPQVPYESLPDFPPKPFQTKKSKLLVDDLQAIYRQASGV
jgi:hypothetical protein